MSAYAFGATVRVGVTVKDPTGALTDPSALTLTYKAPGQVGVTSVNIGSLTHDSTGVYHYDIAVATAGTWHYRFVSTNPAASDESVFSVRTLETV